MKETDLKKYLAGVFSIELNIYTLTETIQALTKQYNALAIRKKISVPIRGEPEVSLFECMIAAGLPIGILVGIIDLIIEWNRANGFFYYIASVIAAMIYAAAGMVAGGILLGIVLWCIRRKHKEKQLEEEFQRKVQQYDAEVTKQNARMSNERAKQKVLAREITSLEDRLAQSKENLSRAYSYQILAPEYRNIYAVSSIYGYLLRGQTHSLQFNEETGDQGAYNIYETQRRLDRIITNTDEILVRLDHVMDCQRDLVLGLQEASRKIESLCGNVNAQLKRITGSVANIEQCTQIASYNSQRAADELAFLNWMAIWH